MLDLEWKECELCGDDVHIARWQLGYRVCKTCGDLQAKEERNSWCIIQESTKQGYTFVTANSARKILMDTNPKAPRS